MIVPLLLLVVLSPTVVTAVVVIVVVGVTWLNRHEWSAVFVGDGFSVVMGW